MKSIYSVAAVVLLALAVPMSSSSKMKDMPMKDHSEGQGKMMEKGNMGPMDEMGGMMDMCMENADKMGLAEEQIAKMKPLHSEMQKRNARYMADLKIAKIELRDLMEVKDFDLDKANAAAKKISDITAAHELEMLKSMKEMRAILTEDQFKKMKKMMAMHRGERRGRQEGTMKK